MISYLKSRKLDTFHDKSAVCLPFTDALYKVIESKLKRALSEECKSAPEKVVEQPQQMTKDLVAADEDISNFPSLSLVGGVLVHSVGAGKI